MKKIFILLSIITIGLFNSGCATWEGIQVDSEDAWDSTKEISKEAWDSTKEISQEAWDSTKEAVSKVTE